MNPTLSFRPAKEILTACAKDLSRWSRWQALILTINRMLNITHIDHLVLTVKDIPTTIEFYARVLGMQAIQFGDTDKNAARIALKFGDQKINLHEAGKEFLPKAHDATPGSADLCLITETDLKQAIAYVQDCNIEIVEGPVERTGATGKLLSFYIRDPDLNLIEISNSI